MKSIFTQKTNWKEVTYNARFAAQVKLIDKAIKDPAGKAVDRRIVDVEDAPEILDWGEKGELLIKIASQSNIVSSAE
jgi:hypothetical protein